MNYISSVIIFILVSALMKYLMDSSKKQPTIKEDGLVVLKMNKAYGIIGYIGIVFSALIGIIASQGTVKSVKDLFIVLALVLFFMLLSVPLVLVSKKMKVEVDEEKVKYYGVTGKTREIFWKEIKEVKFSKTMLELALNTDKTRIKLHMHLVGFPQFVNTMKAKVEYSLYRDAISEIETINGRF